MGSFKQFKLLMWKNFLLQKRRPIGTLVEIGLPTLFIILLVVIRHVTESSNKDKCVAPDCNFPAIPVNQFPEEGQGSACSNWTVAYSPMTAAVGSLVASMTGALSATWAEVPFSTEDEMVDFLVKVNTANPGCQFGLNFTSAGEEGIYDYQLRFASSPGGYYKDNKNPNRQSWFTDQAFPFYMARGPRNDWNKVDEDRPFGGLPGYHQNAFLAVEQAINRAIVFKETGDSPASQTMETMDLQRFPYPQYNNDPFINAVKFGLPLLLMLSLMFTVLSIARNLVYEKEKRLKEALKMMGMKKRVQWTAWFVQYFLFLMIAVIIMTALLGGGKILKHSDITLIFVYLMLYATASISFAFFISTLFSKASTAAAAAGVLWFMSYVPYFFIVTQYDTLSVSSKQSACFISTTAMAIGTNIISTLEASGEGIHWGNIFTGVSVDDPFPFSAVLAMLLFDTIVYFLAAWYVEAVFPGDFGLPEKWNFCCFPSYWCGSNDNSNSDESAPLLESSQKQNGDKFQADPTDIACGVKIDGLRKVFGTKVAVEGTNLSMYEGQIMALLGHNGAGKTTTMSMLTGLYPPSAGTAYISGYDIRQQMSKAQQTMGLCPQHDVLYDTLTVEEHLIFFCRLKDTPEDEVMPAVDKMIADLMLLDKRHAQTKTLSGGMKRKLCVGLALVGGSKVVILDEPTSGMDPAARRATWDLLLKYKEGRTVLLSTHFMDEADLLGDRIAIMSEGRVMCCGSSLFLKSKYGVGYHLSVVKGKNCNTEAVASLVTQHVPSAQQTSNVGSELGFILPRGTESKFSAMFKELDDVKDQYNVDSYGASVTTMEEVFLSVGERGSENSADTVDIQERLNKRSKKPSINRGSGEYGAMENVSDLDDVKETAVLMPKTTIEQSNSGVTLKIQQFKAMLMKRYLYSKRNKMAIISQLLMPFFFAIIALVIAKTVPGPVNQPSRSFVSLGEHYGDNTVYYFEDGQNTLTESLSATTEKYFSDLYGNKVPAEKVSPTEPLNSLVSFLLDKATGRSASDTAYFNRHQEIALNIAANGTDARVTAFFNGQPYHAIAESITAAANIVLKTEKPDVEIRVSNYPLPQTQEERAQAQQFDWLGFNISFTILFGMAFLSSSFALFLVVERTTKAKHIQFVSGVDIFSFWTASYLWDFINFMIPTFCIMMAFLVFKVDAYSGERLGYVFLLFITYGFATIPLMYLASFLFTVSSRAFTWLTLFNIITGLAAMLTIGILDQVDPSTADQLKGAFLFMPGYCFGQGLSDLYNNYKALEILYQFYPGATHSMVSLFCKQAKKDENQLQGLSCNPDYLSFSAPGIGSYTICMFAQGLIFFILVLLVEARVLQRTYYAIASALGRRSDEEFAKGDSGELEVDEDVAEEKMRVKEQISSGKYEDVVLIKDLTKVYRSGCKGQPKVAVDHLSVGIPRGECFGLLGVNGAGKTTTFRMLTGDEPLTKGTAVLSGYDIHTQMPEVRKRMGYCPQFDGLIDLMTGREILTMYANLRGVPEKDVPSVVSDLIDALMLEKHADKNCGSYSGGNRRKLSTAVALVGDPPVVFLDEPTTGMDAGARRFLWDALIHTMQEGRSIVLTSHLMEECEVLCTRLAIMVNGTFRCIGSTQHLKSRFGQGFSVTAKLKDNKGDTSPLKEYINSKFPNNTLKEERQGQLKYFVHEKVAWSDLFDCLEKASSQFDLEDYAVSQTTLEEVFVEFAKHQDVGQAQESHA